MKKIAFLVSLASLAWQSNATISTTAWGKHYSQFNQQTNLVYGKVLLNSGLASHQRFWGNIEYNTEKADCRGNDSCSYRDKGIDPMADLVVQLFPSAGPVLNAQGAGSINFNQNKLIDFISGMFKIDDDVRKNGLKSEVFSDISIGKPKKRVAKKYFNSRSETTKLYRIGRNIANAILLEKKKDNNSQSQFTKESSNNPYPPFYTNYLICAYAWNVLNDNQLDMLSEQLAKKLNYVRGEYNDPFTEILVNPEANLLFPFHPGDIIIENGNTEYNNIRFADCVETTLRHFCLSIFSKIIYENGSRTVILDLDRIPEGSPLREFFAPQGVLKNINELANDGSRETRQEWANIVSSLPNIDYCKENCCELDTGWANFIKTFCYLMKGYSGSEEAANQIRKINEGNESIKSSTEVIDILNNLLKIRTDVELIATKSSSDLIKDKNSKIFGKVSIYPNVTDKTILESNTLNFHNNEDHAHLQSISIEDPQSSESSSWIEELHNNWELAVRGHSESYEDLNQSTYPLLDFYFRMGTGSVESREKALEGILSSSTPHIDAVARSITLDCLDFVQNRDNEQQDLSPLSSEQRTALYKSTIRLSNNWSTIAEAIKLLEEETPGEIYKMFLKTDENGKLNINEKTSILDLILLRIATKRYTEIDPFIEKYIDKIVIDSNQNKKQLISSFKKIILIFREISRFNTHLFEESMSKLYIKHLKTLFNRMNECQNTHTMVNFSSLFDIDKNCLFFPLKLMKFDKNDDTLEECINCFFDFEFAKHLYYFESKEFILSYITKKLNQNTCS